MRQSVLQGKLIVFIYLYIIIIILQYIEMYMKVLKNVLLQTQIKYQGFWQIY